MADVFISYKAERRNAAEHLRHILEAHGFTVWYDYQLKVGTDFDLQIMRELNAAKAVIVLWDTLSVKSPWVMLEAMTSRFNETYLPVMIERCDLSQEFKNAQYQDLSKWDARPAPYEPEGLIEDVERFVGKKAAPDRATLRKLREEWHKYGAQSLKAFALTAVPDKRETEKTPPADIEAAARAASRQGQASITQTSGDASAEFKLIENSLNVEEYQLFLSHVKEGPLAFRAARQLKQVEAWDSIDQKDSQSIAAYLSRQGGEKQLFPALRTAVREAQRAVRSPVPNPSGLLMKGSIALAAVMAVVFVAFDPVRIMPWTTQDVLVEKPPDIVDATSNEAAGPATDQTPVKRTIRTVEERVSLTGHGDWVTSAAFSPNSTRIVTGSRQGTAKVWDARTGETLITFTGHESAVWSAAFSPDGTRIVTGSADNTAKVWDARTGETLATLTGHERFVWSAAFSPDGTRIVTGSTDNTAKVWDARSGDTLTTLTGHGNRVTSTAFSPDGTRIVTGSADNTAKVWDARSGETLATLTGHGDWVTSAAFSPNSTRIVTGSRQGTAKVWDARTGETLVTFTGHESAVWSAAFSPDGTRIVTGSADNTAKVWDARTGETLATLTGHTGPVTSAAFSPDGTRIVTGSWDDTAKVWEIIEE